jgi:5-methylcytosine-specific restriction endonuclease McrA
VGSFSQVYNMPAWRRVRLVVLERDGRLCQIRGPRCQLEATEVDHIVRPEDGGAWYDEVNLRAACGPCNHGRGGKIGAFRTNSRYMAGPRPSREW